ncbi:hypothetical protein BN1723_008514 [Verticillium longisporum]|uniref:Uncharacterized protein n=1 Tax=Verticillium longisporum TaxID=100787 RepID=A0A0G4KGE9_VERLO|nr:hypothetical protein BN1723_008514 [Verticillium longisporum]
MAPSKTKTMKNKHAGGRGGQNKHQDRKPGPPDGIVRAKKTAGTPPSTKTIVQNKVARLLEKRKRDKNKKYTDEELGLPKLNMITPVGVEKPKGKKKGKIFVDDRDGLRKKRKRSNKNTGVDEDRVSELAAAGTRATKPKSKKRVSFAG